MQKCLIVLGMHRSGTSAIAGFLNMLGMPLGSNLLIPNEYNEKGYFENSYIVKANDDILQTLGSSWDDPFLLEGEWCRRPELIPHRDVVKNIIEQEFSANELFCIKDPRISILLPFWISLLQELNIETGFIIPLRHPIEVAESLKARDGFSIQKGLLLWMNNMLSIEYYSRPFRRSFFIFDDFLKSPADTIHRLSNKFNLVFPNAKSQIDIVAKELLDPKLKHHNIKAINFNSDLMSLIDRLNKILLNLNNNSELGEDDLIAVDEIRGEYKGLSSAFYNQDIRKEILSLKITSADLKGQITILTQALAERDGQNVTLNQANNEYNDQIADLNQALAARDVQIHALNNVVSEQAVQIQALDQILNNRELALNSLTADLGRIISSSSWKMTMPFRFVGRILHGNWDAVQAFIQSRRNAKS